MAEQIYMKDPKAFIAGEREELLSQKAAIGLAMDATGGSFVRYLGLALIQADTENTIRIYCAFPDYWFEYLHRALEMES